MQVRWGLATALTAYAAGAALQTAQGTDPPAKTAAILVFLAVPVAVGGLLAVRVPGTLTGGALAWLGAAPTLVSGIEDWGQGAPSSPVAIISEGAWVWNLAGFVALCLVFPNGLLPGRRWRRVALGCGAAGLVVNASQSLVGAPGHPEPLIVPVVVLVPIAIAGFGVCLAALAGAVASLVVHYRRGDERARQQLRWLMLGAGSVPVLQAAGWGLEAAGASQGVAYLGLFVALLIVLPVTIGVAVLRYDLYDVDRLLNSSLAWLLTTVASAAVFAAIVAIAAEAGAASLIGITGAAFVTALLLLPAHRWINDLAGRVIDRDRYVVAARVGRFVRDVQDGRAEPEQAEQLFREVLGDPGVKLVLRAPGAGAGPGAGAAEPGAGAAEPGAGVVPLRSGDAEIGAIVLGTVSARRLRRAREVAHTARLPIVVSRLRLDLRDALHDVQRSRARLAEAAADERRALERDLHDGAQQQIVSIGMRLRSTQSRLDPGSAGYAELDEAVEALEATIAELRRLAHGLRPAGLDDGLAAALRRLVAGAPVPVRLAVSEDPAGPPLADVVATTAYFVVAEAYANALKHARAGVIEIDVTAHDGTLSLAVADDGVGGVADRLTSVRDRVASVGGRLTVESPPGAGTVVAVEIPDAHRRR